MDADHRCPLPYWHQPGDTHQCPGTTWQGWDRMPELEETQ